MNRFLLSAVVVAGGLALTPVVYAQAVSPAPEQGRAAERARPLPGERIEARLAYAKTALKITPAQEQQWNVLAEVLRKHARAMDEQAATRRAARDAGNQPVPANAIERLEQRQKMMQAASLRMNEVLEAAKPLYASLSDDQKKEADSLLNQRGGRGGPHRPRWH